MKGMRTLPVGPVQFEKFLNLTSGFIHICSRKGTEPFHLAWMGGAVETVTGFPPQELLQTGCWMILVHPEDRPGVSEFLHASKPGDSGEILFRLIRKDGEVRYIQETFCLEKGGTDDELSLYGILNDVTAKREAEGRLQDSRERLARCLEGTNDGMWEIDLRAGTAIVSSRWKEMIGIPKEAEIDPLAQWRTRLHPDDRANITELLDRCISGRIVSFECEHRLLHEDGLYRWVLGRGKHYKDQDGNIILISGANTDITEKKRAEIARNNFDMLIMHDIRSPLMSIVSMPDLLQANSRLTGEERQWLRSIQDQGVLILKMLDDFNNLYKLEIGKYPLNAFHFDIDEICSDILTQLAYFKAVKQVRMNKVYVNNSGKERICLKADYNLCHSMLTNLIKNAVEASPGGEDIDIEIRPDDNALAIRNKGEVPKAIRENFFEKYVTDGKKNGTGIGTYSAKLIANAHGWKLALDCSVPGETTVHITFHDAD